MASGPFQVSVGEAKTTAPLVAVAPRNTASSRRPDRSSVNAAAGSSTCPAFCTTTEYRSTSPAEPPTGTPGRRAGEVTALAMISSCTGVVVLHGAADPQSAPGVL